MKNKNINLKQKKNRFKMYVFYLSVSLGLLVKQSISSFASDQNNKKATANKTKLISKTSLHQVFRLKRNYHKTWINTMYHLRVNWFKVRRLKITTNNKYILIFEKNIQGVASSILNTCVGRGTLLESHWVERIRNFGVYYGFFYIFVSICYLWNYLDTRPYFIYFKNNSIAVISSKDTIKKEKRNSKTWVDIVVINPCH